MTTMAESHVVKEIKGAFVIPFHLRILTEISAQIFFFELLHTNLGEKIHHFYPLASRASGTKNPLALMIF